MRPSEGVARRSAPLGSWFGQRARSRQGPASWGHERESKPGQQIWSARTRLLPSEGVEPRRRRLGRLRDGVGGIVRGEDLVVGTGPEGIVDGIERAVYAPVPHAPTPALEPHAAARSHALHAAPLSLTHHPRAPLSLPTVALLLRERLFLRGHLLLLLGDCLGAG